MPITQQPSITLIDALRPRGAPSSSGLTASRGSPGEFEGALKAAEGIATAGRIAPATGPSLPEGSGSVQPTGEVPRSGLVSEPSGVAGSPEAMSAEEADAAVLAAILAGVETVDVSAPADFDEEALLARLAALEAEEAFADPDGTPSAEAMSLALAASVAPTSMPTPESRPVAGTEPSLTALLNRTSDGHSAISATTVSVATSTEEAISLVRSGTAVPGKDFPTLTIGGERISSQDLLQALSADMFGDEDAEMAPSPWRLGAAAVAEGENRLGSLAGLALNARGGAAAVGIGSTMGSEPGDGRLAMPLTAAMLASQGAKGVPATPVGTLPALQGADVIHASSRGMASTGTTSRESASGILGQTPLQRAQQAIQRRAAFSAFLDRSAVGESGNVPTRSETALRVGDSSRLARELSRSMDASVESFVRAERSRTRTSVASMSPRSSQQAEWESHSSTAQAGAHGATPPPAAMAAPPVTSATVASTPQAYAPLMEYIATESRRHIKLGKREFRIQLNPESLGAVELEVVLDEDVLTVRIKAASKESQKILEDHIRELEDALNRQGIGMDADLPWKGSDGSASRANSSRAIDLRAAIWARSWRPGVTVR